MIKRLLIIKNAIIFSILGFYLIYGLLSNEFAEIIFPGFSLFLFLCGIFLIIFAQIYYRSGLYDSKKTNKSEKHGSDIKSGQSWFILFIFILIFVTSISHYH